MELPVATWSCAGGSPERYISTSARLVPLPSSRASAPLPECPFVDAAGLPRCPYGDQPAGGGAPIAYGTASGRHTAPWIGLTGTPREPYASGGASWCHAL